MKKVTHSPSSLVLFASIVFLAYFAAKPYTGGVIDHHKVGDVVYSILPETQFKALHGDGWKLMDGSAIDANDDLKKVYNITNVPDARGRFLRGLNIDDTKGVDPEKNRKVGSLQNDMLAKHNHDFILDIEMIDKGDEPRECGDRKDYNNSNTKQTKDFGGDETRPKNVAFYIYIKVDER